MNEIPLLASAYIKAFLITLPLCLLFLAVIRKRGGGLSRFSVILLRVYQTGFILLFMFLLLPVQFRLLPYKPEIATAAPLELTVPEGLSEEPEESIVPGPFIQDSAAPEPGMHVPVLKKPRHVLSFIWYFLLFSGLALYVGQHLRKFRYLRRLEKSGSESLFRRMRIISTSYADTAFSCGVFRKKIFIPASYTASFDNRIAVIHEGRHHRNHDPFWLNIHHLLACLFWFNPVHLLIYLKAKQGHEFVCDTDVLESVALNAYLHSLVRAADMYRLASRRPLSHLLTGKNRLKERITIMISKEKQTAGRLSGDRRKRRYAVIAGLALSFAFLFGFVSKVTAQEELSSSKAGIAAVLKLVEKGDARIEWV